MAIVIHGASSFLGKHLVMNFLKKGKSVIIISRSTSDLKNWESNPLIKTLLYEDKLSNFETDIILPPGSSWYELAWAGVFGSERNQSTQIEINIPMTISSISLAARLGINHWIGIGSQAEYGRTEHRVLETDSCIPTTTYGKSKLWCSQISSELCSIFGIGHSWLRLFSVYGPEDNHEWLIQFLIRKMLAGEPINVTPGEQFWDYLYIKDVATALATLHEHEPIGVTNLGSGNAVQIKTLIEKIKQFTNSSSIINYGAIPYRDDQVMFMEAENKKLCTLLKWNPSIDLDTGIRNTIEHIKSMKNE